MAADFLPADHMVLRVRSLAASLPYYETLLPLIGFAPCGERSWCNPQGLMVHFDEAEAATAPYDRFAAGLNHFGFRASSIGAVEAVGAAMRKAGFEVPDIEDFPGARALFMRDPDGIRFEIGYEENGR